MKDILIRIEPDTEKFIEVWTALVDAGISFSVFEYIAPTLARFCMKITRPEKVLH